MSYRVCEELDWRKPDGSLTDTSCRVALLRMHGDGLIELPAPRRHSEALRAYARRTPPGEPAARLEAPLSALGPVRLELVERCDSGLCNELIDPCHYLGDKPLAGAQPGNFADAGEPLVAVLGFAAEAWQTAPRDEWIGWSSAQWRRNLGAVVDNARFLILPWVRVPHLASKRLGWAARTLPRHWQARYGYRPVLLETFMEAARFSGICYQAANWVCVGETLARGKLGDHRPGQVPVKTVWLWYPVPANAAARNRSLRRGCRHRRGLLAGADWQIWLEPGTSRSSRTVANAYRFRLGREATADEIDTVIARVADLLR